MAISIGGGPDPDPCHLMIWPTARLRLDEEYKVQKLELQCVQVVFSCVQIHRLNASHAIQLTSRTCYHTLSFPANTPVLAVINVCSQIDPNETIEADESSISIVLSSEDVDNVICVCSYFELRAPTY